VCTPPNNNYWDKAQFQLLPVTDVTFDQAATYAAFTGGRLPTEAEWEMGCRGGDGRIYPWPEVETAAGKLNFGNSFGRTTEAGTYPPGTHGLYDMAGNVWEWTADWFDAGYYAAAPAADPQGPAAPGVLGTRTLRGGSWRNDLSLVRCAYRDDDPPGSAYYNVGLRTVAPGGVRGWLAVTQVRRSGWSLRSAAPYVAVPPAPIDAR
jgi:formylglycine-generating enzyme required for sulfatase activity